MRYAVVNTASGLVENVIKAAPGFDPGPGLSLVEATEATEIGGTWTGAAFSPAPHPLSLEDYKALLREELVGLYSREIARYLTPGKDQIYVKKGQEAEKWQAASSPRVLSDYPFAVSEARAVTGKAEINVTEADVQSVVDTWVAKIAYWTQKGREIERVYIAAGMAIDNATTHEEAHAALGVGWPTP